MSDQKQTRPATGGHGHRSNAEEAATLLALVVAVVLGMAVLTFLLLELIEVLPPALGIIAFVSLAVLAGVLGKALLTRALSTPLVYRRHTPVVRHSSR